MPDDESKHANDEYDQEPSTTNESSEVTTPSESFNELKEQPTPAAVSQPIKQPPVDKDMAQSTLPKPSAGLLVLQWLTYAFWGWTLFSLAILISMVMSTLLTNDRSTNGFGEGIAYVLAAVIVLFVISLITDIFYSKREKMHAQSSGSNVIMIIHAVLFALIGIGSLITAVFGGMQLLIGESTDSDGSLAVLYSALISAALYGMVLLRVLQPDWLKYVTKIYWTVMTVVVIVACVMGIAGPAMDARLEKDDERIEQGLSDVSREINAFARKNGKLPTSLKDLSGLDKEANRLVSDGKIKYTAGEKVVPSTSTFNQSNSNAALQRLSNYEPSFRYELCVTYNLSDSYGESYSNDYDSDGNYPTSPRTYGHESGDVCYDLQTRTVY